jgi:hypothetical protein
MYYFFSLKYKYKVTEEEIMDAKITLIKIMKFEAIPFLFSAPQKYPIAFRETKKIMRATIK